MRYRHYSIRSQPRPKPSDEIPILQKLDRLSLPDLRKIRKFAEKYRDNLAAAKAENIRIEEENRMRRMRNERSSALQQRRLDAWENESGWLRLGQRQKQIYDHLWKMRVGAIAGTFRSTV